MSRTDQLTPGAIVATLGIFRPGQTRRARSVRRVTWRTVENVCNAAGLCRVQFTDGTHAVSLFDEQWHRQAGTGAVA